MKSFLKSLKVIKSHISDMIDRIDIFKNRFNNGQGNKTSKKEW